MRRSLALFLFAFALPLLVLAPGGAAQGSHYVPQTGDNFHYAETVVLSNGIGNYSTYSENSAYTGAVQVTAVSPNLIESAYYQYSGTFRNNSGASVPESSSGPFTFSASNFTYVSGTDDQVGYTPPIFVWFYIDNTLSTGSTLTLLNTPMSVVSTDYSYPYAASSTGYVKAIFVEGNGSYQRNDVYGQFTATYNWKGYFDPGTGYTLGYVVVETDSNPQGDGFTYTDALSVTSTSYALTPAAAPPSTSSGSGSTPSWVLLGIVIAVVIVAILIVALLLYARSRRRAPAAAPLPRHSSPTLPAAPPTYYAPPPVNLIPQDQPKIQQVVIRETVKVPCPFCGTLMDSTATNCPKCGAPRT